MSQNGVDEAKGHYSMSIHNDSIYTVLYDNYLKKVLNDSVVVEEFGIVKDGHAFRKEGFYLERNRKGKVLVIGEYLYNRKIGRWTYFYENGQIKRIENYSLPFCSQLYDLNIKLLHQIGPFLHGNQIEYYSSGQIKKIENYEIYDLKRNKFRVMGRDSNTYEEIPISIEEEFWVPTSMKTGKWIKFDESGEIEEEHIYYVDFNDQIRQIPLVPRFVEYDYLNMGNLNGTPY